MIGLFVIDIAKITVDLTALTDIPCEKLHGIITRINGLPYFIPILKSECSSGFVLPKLPRIDAELCLCPNAMFPVSTVDITAVTGESTSIAVSFCDSIEPFIVLEALDIYKVGKNLVCPDFKQAEHSLSGRIV